MASLTKAFSEGISLTWNSFRDFALVGVLLFLSQVIIQIPSLVAEFTTDPALEALISLVSIGVLIAMTLVMAVLIIWALSISFTKLRSTPMPFSMAKVGWFVLFTLFMAAVAFALMFVLVFVMYASIGIGTLIYTQGGWIGVLIFGLVSFVLLIGLAIAWTYFYLRLTGFVSLIIADRGANPFAAIGESWRLSRGRVLELFGLMFMVGVLNFAGMLLLGVGLIFTLPASYTVLAHYYDQVRDEA